MAIRTVHLNTEKLPPVMLRRGFERAVTKNGEPVTTDKGEPLYYGEAVLPGLVSGRFNMEPGYGSARVAAIGDDPGIGAGVVRFSGRTTLTATYNPGATFREATRSHLSINAETITTTTETPGGRQLLSAAMPVGMTLLDARSTDNGDWFADVVLDPESSYLVDGIVEIRSLAGIPDDLRGRVTARDLRVRFMVPDALDVSQRNRAELLLSCSGFDLAPAGVVQPFRGRRTPDPEPVAVGSD